MREGRKGIFLFFPLPFTHEPTYLSIHPCVRPPIRSPTKAFQLYLSPPTHPSIHHPWTHSSLHRSIHQSSFLPTHSRLIHQHLGIRLPINLVFYQHIHNSPRNPFIYSFSHSPLHPCVHLIYEPGLLQPIHSSTGPSVHPSGQSFICSQIPTVLSTNPILRLII